jgi:tryptophan synthase alpha subunit
MIGGQGALAADDRIGAAFAAGRAAGRPLVIPFVTAGYPSTTATVPLIGALAAAGADMIEIGMPFSDPLADGPTIQRASERALLNGMTVRKTLALVREARTAGATVPIILMGYCNPLYAYGLETFLTDAAGSGVDGLIVADLPPDEADELLAGCAAAGLAATFLVAPNAPDDRIRRVDAASTHFSYCVTVTGVTGARADLQARTIEFLHRMRKLAQKPFVTGFGIKRPEHVAALGPHTDGVVVGSALIDAIEASGDGDAAAVSAAAAIVAPLREAAARLARPGALEGGDS